MNQVLSVPALLLALGALSSSVVRPSSSQDQCDGCQGSSASNSQSGNSACPDAEATLTVTFQTGRCKAVMDVWSGNYFCVETKKCRAFITRSWSGVPPDTTMDACVTVGSEPRLCLEPPLNSGSGTDSNTQQYDVSCTGTPFNYEFIIAPCGINIGATATCSECPD